MSDDQIRRENAEKMPEALKAIANSQKESDRIMRLTYAFPAQAAQYMDRYLKKHHREGLVAALREDPAQFGGLRGNRLTKDGWSQGSADRREVAAAAAKELPGAVDVMLRAKERARMIEKAMEPARGGWLSMFSRDRDR
jgi:hypothetical protein